jgi:hypothetical protein
MMPNTAKKGKHVSQGLYPEGCKTTCRSFEGILNCEAETMATGTVIMMLKSFGLVDTLGKSQVSSL